MKIHDLYIDIKNKEYRLPLFFPFMQRLRNLLIFWEPIIVVGKFNDLFVNGESILNKKTANIGVKRT